MDNNRLAEIKIMVARWQALFADDPNASLMGREIAPELISAIEAANTKLAASEAERERLKDGLGALVSDRHGHGEGCICPWCNARKLLAGKDPTDGR